VSSSVILGTSASCRLMGIKVDGLDEAIEMTEALSRGLTVEGINEYCGRIREAAKDCGVIEGELELEAVPRGKEFEIKFNLSDRSKFDCIKQAIERVMAFMPITTKAFFEQILKQIEDEK